MVEVKLGVLRPVAVACVAIVGVVRQVRDLIETDAFQDLERHRGLAGAGARRLHRW